MKCRPGYQHCFFFFWERKTFAGVICFHFLLKAVHAKKFINSLIQNRKPKLNFKKIVIWSRNYLSFVIMPFNILLLHVKCFLSTRLLFFRIKDATDNSESVQRKRIPKIMVEFCWSLYSSSICIRKITNVLTLHIWAFRIISLFRLIFQCM